MFGVIIRTMVLNQLSPMRDAVASQELLSFDSEFSSSDTASKKKCTILQIIIKISVF